MTFKPWDHQVEDLDESWKLPAAFIDWEPRLGKSWLAIRTASLLAEHGKIRGAVIIAPNGVHLGWTKDQLPKYWDHEGSRVIEWSTNKSGNRGFRDQLNEALVHDGFVWASVNIESIRRDKKNTKASLSYAFIERLAKKRDCLLILDESHYAKNPSAERTKALMKLAKLFPYRRNLTGTPQPQGPFDLWSQYFILDERILGKAYYPFKTRYGIFRKGYGQGRTYDELVEYRDLDGLSRRIAPITFVRKKADCLDLPERVFSKRYFEMPPEHARHYRQIRDELITQLESGEEVTATMAMVNILRLQQISRGHVNLEGGVPRILEGGHPSVEAAVELVADNLPQKAIVWCQFRTDVELITGALRTKGIEPFVCHGDTPPADRPALIAAFNADTTGRPWVGTLATGGIGVDLGGANLMVFYSHGFNLGQRLQGLERNYGSSQQADRVGVVDIVCPDTVDDRALDSLAKKFDLARKVSPAQWRETYRGLLE
jgi:SNF2 family DNA or RNA helicase